MADRDRLRRVQVDEEEGDREDCCCCRQARDPFQELVSKSCSSLSCPPHLCRIFLIKTYFLHGYVFDNPSISSFNIKQYTTNNTTLLLFLY